MNNKDLSEPYKVCVEFTLWPEELEWLSDQLPTDYHRDGEPMLSLVNMWEGITSGAGKDYPFDPDHDAYGQFFDVVNHLWLKIRKPTPLLDLAAQAEEDQSCTS